MTSAWVWAAFGVTAAVVCVDKFRQGDLALGGYMLMCTVGNFWLGFDNYRVHKQVKGLEQEVFEE